jgi:hypothetical protein
MADPGSGRVMPSGGLSTYPGLLVDTQVTVYVLLEPELEVHLHQADAELNVQVRVEPVLV